MPDTTIARIDRWLATHRPEYYALLQPGASDQALDAFEADFALTLPDAFRQLYRWRNGQHPNSSAPLHGNRTFCSLQDVASIKRTLDGMIDSDFDDARYWRRGWVPFLHNGGGSYLCLDLAADDGGEAGQLIAFWKRDDDRPIEFASIEAWLSSLLAAMEDGSLQLL
jgi:cell wall assembly regulator SMI1